jgi:hypothetical protein
MTGTRSLLAVRYDDEGFNSLDAISEPLGIVLCEVAPKFD